MGFVSTLVLASVLAPASAPTHAPAEPARPIRYESFKYGRSYFHAIVANMASRQVTAEAYYSDRLRNVWKLIGDEQPAAAVTGTFFGYESQQPVADVVVDGTQVASGNRGSAIGVDWYGKVHIFDTPFEQPIDLFGYRHLIRGAVRLIKHGRVAPNPKAQHFTDPAIWGRAARTGVGLTEDGRLVMMATPNRVTLSEFGRAMKRLGVTEGVSLDGGASALLYYRGEIVVAPDRSLSNLFILHERPPF